MARSHHITINGKSFNGRRGDLLLDSALSNGVNLSYDCRSGHCGTCCVRLLEGKVHGGEGSEPGIIHACQSRIIDDIVVEPRQMASLKTVQGTVISLRRASSDVMEVGIRTAYAFPYLAGQYAQVRFKGYPSRPYSLTHPLKGGHQGNTIWLHVRRVEDGRVSMALGKRIALGHPVTLTGPYGAAYFRPNLENRLILVSTGTGFSPIWAIAAAALHENPERKMMIVAGARSVETLYMGSVLGKLSRFPNVRVVPVCSTPQTVSKAVRLGRPTDFLPRLYPSDIIYACGVPAMVDSVKSIASRAQATCYADPFLPSSNVEEDSVLARALGWIPLPTASARQRLAIASRKKKQLRLEAPRRRPQQLAAPYGAA